MCIRVYDRLNVSKGVIILCILIYSAVAQRRICRSPGTRSARSMSATSTFVSETMSTSTISDTRFPRPRYIAVCWPVNVRRPHRSMSRSTSSVSAHTSRQERISCMSRFRAVFPVPSTLHGSQPRICRKPSRSGKSTSWIPSAHPLATDCLWISSAIYGMRGWTSTHFVTTQRRRSIRCSTWY